ncbi:MAG: hypothetical protein IT342_20405 [Candidatus Melainabacteria bacterium]|nr:hypothetical protein [Candidatus Melainabacteria bacterium]
MATSFRLSSEHMKRLEFLAIRLGVSKAQVIKKSIDKLYEAEIRHSKRTMLDRLSECEFEPVDARLEFDASDEEAQRKIMREKISQKRRS